jgi:DNA-binding MurR/RpiR family transcriptional regulator
MANDLLNIINVGMNDFSKGQKLIAKYILDNYEKAAFMTASAMGAVVGVSESTIVRFAVELGFAGYPSLQTELQKIIRNKLTSLQRIEVATSKFEKSEILSGVLASDIDKIKKTIIENDNNDFKNVIDTILNANTIYILGVRSSNVLATFLGYYFNLIFENVKHIGATYAGETLSQLLRLKKDDVVIGISFPRYSQDTIRAMKYCSDVGAKVIAITDSKQSPIAKYADNTLVAFSDMTSFVDSLVAPLSLINALIVAVTLSKKQEVSKTLTELEDVWKEYGVYENQNEQEKL